MLDAHKKKEATVSQRGNAKKEATVSQRGSAKKEATVSPRGSAKAVSPLWLISCRFLEDGLIFEAVTDSQEEGISLGTKKRLPAKGAAADRPGAGADAERETGAKRTEEAKQEDILPSFEEALHRLQEEPWLSLYDAGFARDDQGSYAAPVRFLFALSRLFAAELFRKLGELEFLREKISLPCPPSFLTEARLSRPYALGAEYLTEDWFQMYWERLSDAFRKEIGDSPYSAEDYLKHKKPDSVMYGRVYFHLVEKQADDNATPFAFAATFTAPLPGSQRVRQLPLRQALDMYKDSLPSMLKLLSQVNRAAAESALITNLMQSGDLFRPIALTADEAYAFLREIPLYEQSGIYCRIPDWWRKKTRRPVLNIQLGAKKPSRLSLNALLDVDVEALVDGQPLTREEIRALLQQGAGLRMLKGRWVEADPRRLKELLALMEHPASYSLKDALGLYAAQGNLDVGQDHLDAEAGEMVGFSYGRWLSELHQKLLHPASHPLPAPGRHFHATLRPYQREGYQWLTLASQLGLGLCLADDMGLGKTVQVIALLESLRVKDDFTALIVVPASLLSNWERELSRFAPKLSVRNLSGPPARVSEALAARPDAQVSLTTYGLVRGNAEITKIPWDILILDEAQAIKNPGSQQTRAVKKLKSGARIALTGTPIENRLSDLWSLFDFLNPGLLGNKAEFTAFAKSLEENPGQYERLRGTISPFLLRRLKTDRRIIDDLPEKVEQTRYACLTRQQAALYEEVVRELELALDQTEGIQRKGLVLSTIMKLKQICNHGDQYLGQTSFLPEESGKMLLLSEICETIREKRERVLVFTQFREICEALDACLREIFGLPGLVLHGATRVKDRQKMVDQFNGEAYVPYMLLSLKAGGVGLNLTGASHVIHFDRWWNPAVENQATDRAFRIGQRRNVMVHKIVTKATIEEKIDMMIADKQALSQEVLCFDAQTALTELSGDALRQLFRLEEDGAEPQGDASAAKKGRRGKREGKGEGER